MAACCPGCQASGARCAGLPTGMPRSRFTARFRQTMGAAIDPGSVSAAVSFLPQSVQSALAQVGAQVQSAAPLASIAASIDAGQIPSEGQIMAGLAAAGTALTGNPIAGAALAAAGGVISTASQALQTLFTALGWIQPPDPAVTLVGLRLPNSPLPADASSSLWWRIASVNDLSAILQRVNTGQAGLYNVDAANYLGNALQALKTPGYYPSWCYSNPTPFERFFLPMLVKDLERWANGAGFMMPRDLLLVAALTWNASHSSSQTRTYAPVDRGTPGYDCASVVSQLLGAGGDLKPSASYQADSLTINQGPAVSTRPHVTLNLAPIVRSSVATSTAAAARAPATSTTQSSATSTIVAAAGLGALGLVAWRMHRGLVPIPKLRRVRRVSDLWR